VLKINQRIHFVVASAVIVCALQTAAFAVSGADSTTPPSSGITVSPAYITAQVGSAQRQASASVGVRNNFTIPITVTAVLNGLDIRDNALLPTSRSESALADIIKFTPAEITIPPQSSRNISVTITDKPNLAPGGHYVSLLITQSSAVGPNSTPQLSLKPAISATIYLIKEDGAVRSLQVEKIRPNGNIFTLPDSVDVTFVNDGNVASVPRGILTIRRGSGETIYAQAAVNQDSVPLYPKQSTTLRSKLMGLEKPRLPGKLVTVLDYRPDGQVSTKTVFVSTWYLPVSSLIVLSLLVALIGIFAVPKSRRKILKNAKSWQKSNRKPFISPDLNKIANTPKKHIKSSSLRKRHIDVK